MSWVKLDDGFTENAKIVALSDRALRLYLRGLCYAARNRTDGVLDRKALAHIGGTGRLRRELVDARAWDEAEGDVVIHDYVKYNPTRSQVEARRLGAESRKRRERHRKRVAHGHAECHAVTDGVTTTVTHAVRHGTGHGVRPGTGSSIPCLSSLDPEGPDLSADSSEFSSLQGSSDELSESARVGNDQRQTAHKSRAESRADVTTVFRHWQATHGHSVAKLDAKRANRIAARLAQGFTVERLCAAISNAKNDPFLMGENDHGRVYDGIDTLLRDRAQVERLEALTTRPAAGRNGHPRAFNRAEEQLQQQLNHIAELEAEESNETEELWP